MNGEETIANTSQTDSDSTKSDRMQNKFDSYTSTYAIVEGLHKRVLKKLKSKEDKTVSVAISFHS